MYRINEVVRYEGQLYRILSLITDQVIWINVEDAAFFKVVVASMVKQPVYVALD